MTNKTLFFSALSFFALTQAQQPATFATQTFTLQYAVQPKNAADVTDFNSTLEEIVSATKRNANTNLYQSFATFFQNAQAAVAAGLNLLGTVAINQQTTSQIIEELIEAATETDIFSDEASSQPSQEESEATKTTILSEASNTVSGNTTNEDSSNQVATEASCNAEVVIINAPVFILSISITVSCQEDLVLFEAAKEALMNLSQGSAEISQEIENFINQNGEGCLSVTPLQEFVETQEETEA